MKAPYPAFRRSSPLRAGCDSSEALQAAIAPFQVAEDDSIRQLNFDDIDGGAQLLDQLRAEYSGLLEDIVAEGAELALGWDITLLRDIQLDPSRRVDARIEWPEGRLQIKLSEGLCLALDDALLHMLCVLGFFTARSIRDDRPDGYLIAQCGPSSAERYVDYSGLSSLDDPALAAALTSMMPLDGIRLAQADLLLALALEWVALHEQAHALLGHVAWLRDGGTGQARIDEALFLEASTDAERDDSYCLELQADSLATQMLFSHGMSESMVENCWVRRYQAALSEHGDDRRALAPDLTTREGRFHAMLLASAISSLLFELRRERLRDPGVSHPPPATRLLNIFVGAVSAWADVAEYEQGLPELAEGEYSLDLIRPAAHIAGTAFVELEMAARVIGLENPLYRGLLLFPEGERPPARDALSPIADDFYKLLAGTTEPNQLATDAGRTYVALLARSRSLYDEMEDHCQIKGFR